MRRFAAALTRRAVKNALTECGVKSGERNLMDSLGPLLFRPCAFDRCCCLSVGAVGALATADFGQPREQQLHPIEKRLSRSMAGEQCQQNQNTHSGRRAKADP